MNYNVKPELVEQFKAGEIAIDNSNQNDKRVNLMIAFLMAALTNISRPQGRTSYYIVNEAGDGFNYTNDRESITKPFVKIEECFDIPQPIGYRSPKDYFGGRIKAGDVLVKEEGDTNSYVDKKSQLLILPAELVETFKPAYEPIVTKIDIGMTEFKVVDGIVVDFYGNDVSEAIAKINQEVNNQKQQIAQQ